VVKNIFKSLAGAAVLALALPASAQFRAHVDIPLPGLEVRIGHRAPPPLRHEVVAYRPSSAHVWVSGFWHWNGYDWTWIPGHWERPSYRGARWIAARYRSDAGRWIYEPGHWSHQRLVYGNDYNRYYRTRSYRDSRYRDGYRERDRRDRYDHRYDHRDDYRRYDR
jgi:hypothetical protein